MKVVLLAGGFGTRISEETSIRPKPMVEIGGNPILWHIMRQYAAHGLTDFVICAGYKSDYIRNYFLNYRNTRSDFTMNLRSGKVEFHETEAEDWNVTVVDTGLNTMTGGRIKAARQYIGDEPFCVTYGDGVSNVNITDLIQKHKESEAYATLTAVVQPGRFGGLSLDSNTGAVRSFREKAAEDGNVINGGFFVCEPEVFDYIDGPETIWERDPLERLVADNKLNAYRHFGFWQPMDTLRDRNYLEGLWEKGDAPWAPEQLKRDA
ncbi:glucose-1-phosphate cytidylyltransferase [Hyphomonas sp.]|jgi:glucose-1-phosphate cytidylyltransferase|uniref:glucose-1-phosphate cytidylyltransferase n=1 Tax=Hyphomonas sp. TaxID=87 RepID=UPI0025BCBC97|nr:glucose-1-phosphate cytidylyltransferase [Hyphomonas sp.]MEE2922140.1 glucose-1-phosphate cytidylyltransferase [Pseudomonadota bacterium]